MVILCKCIYIQTIGNSQDDAQIGARRACLLVHDTLSVLTNFGSCTQCPLVSVKIFSVAKIFLANVRNVSHLVIIIAGYWNIIHIIKLEQQQMFSE